MLVRRLAATALSFACVLLAVPYAAPAQDASAGVPSFAEPAVSPDHSEIAFVSGGDVWSVPSGGGVARVLVAAGGAASRPLFSPDGKRLAFVSSRPGAIGVYVVALDGGTLTRLTHDDVPPNLSAWSPDGRYVYFSTSEKNIAYFGDVMRVPASGGTPMRVVGERFVNAMDAAPSPDGASLAYIRNGFVQWWRRGHSHMDESELVVERNGTYDELTHGDAKDRWPMWSPDGRTLYFVSDRSGSDQLWSRGSDGRLKQLTSLAGGEDVLWPTISRDGRTIAFEHAFGIWTYDVASGATQRLAIEPRGIPDVTQPQRVTLASQFTALDLSPDGKKVAFVARGHVFAADAAQGGEALEATTHEDAAYDLPVWSKDSRHVALVVDRGTEQAIATYAFPDGPETILTPAGHHDDYPHWSPDGTLLAFVRDGRELHVLNVATKADRVVARGIMDRRPFGDLGDIAFSPAGDWIAYVDTDRQGFQNVVVVPVHGGEPRPITFLPNTNGGPIAWAPDGTRLYFVTSQRTENGQIAQIDLIPRAPRFREDEFRRLFQTEPNRPELPTRTIPSAPPSTAPSPAPSASPRPRPFASPTAAPSRHTTIDFAGLRDRVTMLPTGLDAVSVGVTPDGKTLVFVANAAAEQNVYAFSVDETSPEAGVARQLTSTRGRKTFVNVAPDGRSIVYLDAGRVAVTTLAPPQTRALAIAASLEADFGRDKPLVFRQAWSLIDRWYADPHFHGADWNAVFREYEPHVLGARTPAEFRRVISLMLGELNSSHSGIYAPASVSVPRVLIGRLGVQWDPAAYERSGRLRIAELVPLGPLALAGHVAVGDDVVAIDGTTVERTTDVDALLENTIGKRTEVRIAPHGDLAAARTVVVQPVDLPTEQDLLYRSWAEGRRAYVDRISGGRIGYVHLLDMSPESLQRFWLDLDVQNREKQAVIVDIRNNEGGFVDPYAIDVLTRREYASFKSRFGYDASERTSLGQRVLDKPTALLVNEHSLSDAENFTEAYRVLHAGPVVGEPTAGWIIFTSAATLADGSTLRLPSTSVIGPDGVNLELHPRPVDVRAALPPGALERGDDPQLDAAVRTLLHRR
ncbi:MAG TPA: S41 family peptidase [Candidatus Baltobacteraceae bacterium]|nr:S41 family peptidase [Candidatus Baltobacteraceae bacterium]